MIESWNKCTLVFSNARLINSRIDRFKLGKIKAFIKQYGADHNIWYDESKRRCFSIAQNGVDGAPKTFRSFLCPPSMFLNDEKMFNGDCGGKNDCLETLGSVLGTEVLESTEFILHNSEALNSINGKTVLIVGAGPSTSAIDWKAVNYDQLWSCNHFFQNKHLGQKKVDLWVPTDEVDIISNKILAQYLAKNPSSTCCLYPTRSRDLDYLKLAKTKIPNMTYFHTRYRSKIGIMPRLILLAIFGGAKDILFVGMDGLPTRSMQHAFEQNKVPKGSAAHIGAINMFKTQYVQLWDYILFSLKAKNNLFNLGENIDSNLSADVSRSRFPLNRLYSSEFKHLVNKIPLQ